MTDFTSFDPPIDPPNNGSIPEHAAGGDFSNAARLRGVMLSFEEVQAALVEAIEVRLRQQGSGYWPFAKDGPWALIQRDWVQLVEDALAGREVSIPKGKPSRAELAMMQVRLEWLMLVPKDDDRRLVVKAITMLARNWMLVPWGKLVEPKARWRTGDGLRMRYGRAMADLTRRVNRLPVNERQA